MKRLDGLKFNLRDVRVMKKTYILLISFIFFIVGCNQSDKRQNDKRDSILEAQLSAQDLKIRQLQLEVENSKAKAQPVEEKKQEESPFYKIGSTENEVLTIQGQPTSIIDLPPNKAFYYGSSYVSFRNGIVESFSNSGGNLRIKIVPSGSDNSKDQSHQTEQASGKTNNITKYVYFYFFTDDVWQNYYSKIYEISGYTFNKEESLQFCLATAFKEWTGKKVTMGPRSFDDRQSAFASWNDEKGNIFQDACGSLMQLGIFSQ
jgi:hypothetical protein